METLWKPLEELNAYGGARECIERGRMPVQISGCIDGQKSHLISGLAQSKKWTVIVAANERKARELLADYRMYDKEAVFYPAKDVIFYSADVHGNAVETERLKTIKSLFDQEGGTVITTMTAGMEYVQSLSVYKKSCRRLEEGGQVDLEELTPAAWRIWAMRDRVRLTLPANIPFAAAFWISIRRPGNVRTVLNSGETRSTRFVPLMWKASAPLSAYQSL